VAKLHGTSVVTDCEGGRERHYRAETFKIDEITRRPSMIIQLALNEHYWLADEDKGLLLPADQQTLSDILEDIMNIPAIDVQSQLDLSDHQARRLQNPVQWTFDELC